MKKNFFFPTQQRMEFVLFFIVFSITKKSTDTAEEPVGFEK